MRVILLLCSVFGVAACVAPEPPPPPRVERSATPAPSRVGFEDAPTPNRKLAPVSDSVIRLAH